MLASAASAPRGVGVGDAVTFIEGNAEALPFADRSFDAYTIAFGIRNVPRIDLALGEAFRVLRPGGRFLCLEFSTVDMPGLDRIYDLFSFKVIPALGRAVAGDAESYRYLVESIRKFPSPDAFAEMIRAAGFSPRLLQGPFRRHRGAAFGLAPVISAIPRIAPARPRRLRVRARGRVWRRRSGLVPPPARARRCASPGWSSAGRRHRGLAAVAALTRLGPTYLKLGQFLATRPDVVGVAMARDLESLQDQMPPFPQGEAEACRRGVAGPAD